MSIHYPAELLIAANENDSGPSSTQALNGLIALLARAKVRAIARPEARPIPTLLQTRKTFLNDQARCHLCSLQLRSSKSDFN